MKNYFLIAFLLILLSFQEATAAESDLKIPAQAVPAPMINIYADKFLNRIWPQLPESYRIMASISASLLDETKEKNNKDRQPAPLVGISLTIEW